MALTAAACNQEPGALYVSPLWWQGPVHLGHPLLLSQVHQRGARSEAQQARQYGMLGSKAVALPAVTHRAPRQAPLHRSKAHVFGMQLVKY